MPHERRLGEWHQNPHFGWKPHFCKNLFSRSQETVQVAPHSWIGLPNRRSVPTLPPSPTPRRSPGQQSRGQVLEGCRWRSAGQQHRYPRVRVRGVPVGAGDGIPCEGPPPPYSVAVWNGADGKLGGKGQTGLRVLGSHVSILPGRSRPAKGSNPSETGHHEAPH